MVLKALGCLLSAHTQQSVLLAWTKRRMNQRFLHPKWVCSKRFSHYFPEIKLALLSIYVNINLINAYRNTRHCCRSRCRMNVMELLREHDKTTPSRHSFFFCFGETEIQSEMGCGGCENLTARVELAYDYCNISCATSCGGWHNKNESKYFPTAFFLSLSWAGSGRFAQTLMLISYCFSCRLSLRSFTLGNGVLMRPCDSRHRDESNGVHIKR